MRILVQLCSCHISKIIAMLIAITEILTFSLYGIDFKCSFIYSSNHEPPKPRHKHTQHLHNLRTMWNHLSTHYVHCRVKWSSVSALICLIQPDENPSPVITFRRQSKWCYTTGQDWKGRKELPHSTDKKSSRTWSDWDQHLGAIEESFNEPLKKCYHIVNPLFLW